MEVGLEDGLRMNGLGFGFAKQIIHRIVYHSTVTTRDDVHGGAQTGGLGYEFVPGVEFVGHIYGVGDMTFGKAENFCGLHLCPEGVLGGVEDMEFSDCARLVFPGQSRALDVFFEFDYFRLDWRKISKQPRRNCRKSEFSGSCESALACNETKSFIILRRSIDDDWDQNSSTFNRSEKVSHVNLSSLSLVSFDMDLLQGNVEELGHGILQKGKWGLRGKHYGRSGQL